MTGSLWRHTAFRQLWLAQTLSQLGSQVTLVALPLTAIAVLHATALQVGVLTALAYLPFLLVGLPAGVWVDRLRRRPVLIVADLGRAIALATIPAAYLAGVLDLVLLYAVALVTGVLTVFFDVAHVSYLPSLVARDRLLDGNAKLEVSRSAAVLAGPGLGGALVQALTAPVAIATDAASYLASAALLLRIRQREQPPRPPGTAPDGRGGMLAEIGEGLRFVLGHPLLRPIVGCTALLNLAFGATEAVLVLYAVRVLGLSPVEIGVVFVAGNASGLIGALASKAVGTRLGPGPTIIAASAAFAAGTLVFPLATPASGPFVLAAGLFLTGACANVYNITQVSLRQAVTPPRLLGRMNSSMRFVVWGVIPLGAVLGGLLAGPAGPRTVLWLAVPVSLAAALPVLASPLRGLREVPAECTPDPEDGPDADTADGVTVELVPSGPRRTPMFCAIHPGPPEATMGLVVCPPLHREFLGNYRREVLLARRLAGAGVPVVRLQYRGTGHSAGDPAEISFDTMVADALTAADRLRRVSGVPELGYLGTRAGALVAAAAARATNAPLLLWEPVLAGADYLREALRAQILADIAAGRGRNGSQRAMRERLHRDGVVDVLGYPMHRVLADSLDRRDLAVEITGAGDGVEVLLVQVGDAAALRPAYQRLAAALRGHGVALTTEVVVEEPISWFFDERWEPEEDRPGTARLLDATAAWLAGRR